MSEVVEETENNVQATHKKRRRHRKKQLYASILKQMEFYFSDAALSKDRFLAQMLEKDPFVPLDVFLRFNKIKVLTSKISDIAGALQDSKVLVVSEDNLKVKRTTALAAYDADARTVYVESIPVTADLTWLTNVFQEYGKVAYVSLPKYFNTNRIKGFAFVEFQNEEDAKKCLESFTAMGCKLPTNIKAETLASCQGFQPDVSEPFSKSDAEQECKDIKPDVVEDEEPSVEEPLRKKAKKRHSTSSADSATVKDKQEECEGRDKENIKIAETKNEATEDSAAEQSESAAEPEPAPEGDVIKKSKPVRKRKKKDRHRAHKEREKKSLELTARSLQLLSKCEWKVLRNKYLTLQRKHMKALKQVLRTQHTLPENRNKFPVPVAPGYTDHQAETEEPKRPPAPPEIPFTAGVIVAVKLAEPCVDVRGLRRATKENMHVTFVDVKEGQTDIHIRMDDPDSAKQYAASEVFPGARVLEGPEEQKYWEVLRKQQYEKFSSKRKVRGRDRLINKAKQLAEVTGSAQHGKQHIRFDE